VAFAQEEGSVPGALPDASTYQGSMEMQRQSDAQDQQFRDQQQQAAQQRQQDYEYYSQQSVQSPSTSSSAQNYAPSGQRQTAPSARPAQLSRDPAMAAFQRGDYASAVQILRPRAMQGNPNAEHNLGYLYALGLGVPRDPVQAASWYRKSAEQGFVASQAELGRMYFQGAGVPRDPIEGYKWLLLAGRESPAARQYMQVASRMISYDQMSEATRRARLWTPKKSVPPVQAVAPPVRRKKP
jgi:TPR repeat protein